MPTTEEYGTTDGVDCGIHEDQILNLEKKEKYTFGVETTAHAANC